MPAPDARKLHDEWFVFDFLPIGEPYIMTSRHEAVMNDGLKRRHTHAEILRAMFSDRLEELEEDASVRRTIRDTWKKSGVDGVHLTLGGQELQIDSWDAVVREIGYWRRRAKVGGDMRLCETADDLMQAKRRWPRRLDVRPAERDADRRRPAKA